MNLSSVIEHHADRSPDRVALGFEGETTSYATLVERVHQTAGALEQVGVGKGDVVAVLLHNCPEFLEVMVAAAHLGAIFMPLNWRLAGPELAYILNHAGASLLVTEPELEESVEPVRSELTCKQFARVGSGRSGAWAALDELRAIAEPVTKAAEVAADDVHRLMYTSGTTARPKGVMITYANLYWKNVAHTVELGMTAEDRGLAAGPLYHVGALDLTTTTLLYVGATVYVLPRFDAAAAVKEVERHQVTNMWLAPAMLNLVLAEPSLLDRDLTSVRLIINGGEKMPLPLIERVLAAFPGVWFADAYGLTESVGGDTFLDQRSVRDKIGSVGKPVIHHQVRVVDSEDHPLPPGETGEIVVRGPKVCHGYWRDPGATRATIRNGWLHTGDIGMIDEDGCLYVVDRLKDVIVSGGENIASLEVERVLYEHAAVAEAAVVATADERWGEVPVAYVVLAEGSTVDEKDLAAFCETRLASFKVPRATRFVDALPRNPSGKVLKRELREREGAPGSVASALSDQTPRA